MVVFLVSYFFFYSLQFVAVANATRRRFYGDRLDFAYMYNRLSVMGNIS